MWILHSWEKWLEQWLIRGRYILRFSSILFYEFRKKKKKKIDYLWDQHDDLYFLILSCYILISQIIHQIAFPLFLTIILKHGDSSINHGMETVFFFLLAAWKLLGGIVSAVRDYVSWLEVHRSFISLSRMKNEHGSFAFRGGQIKRDKEERNGRRQRRRHFDHYSRVSCRQFLRSMRFAIPRNTKLHRRRDVDRCARIGRENNDIRSIEYYANVSGPVTGLELRSAAPRTRNPSLPVPTTFFFPLFLSLSNDRA